MTFTETRKNELFSRLPGLTIAVIGDVMIDKYIWGKISRISPEAPVPVVEVETQTQRLGGAANVANNVQSLGCSPLLIGVAGEDDEYQQLKDILEKQKCSTEGIVSDASRSTTVKTRVIAHHQHVVRIDHEKTHDIDEKTEQKILSLLEQQIKSLDAIILEDYNKGLITASLIEKVIALARKHDTVITVDPKFNHFLQYKHVTLFKPNKKETEEALGIRITTEQDVVNAGKKLLDTLKAENVLLTRSEHGMSLFERNGTVTHIPTKARKVADVSGAGDTVIATMTAFLAAGATAQEAASLANTAGGIVCGEVGIVPIDVNILKESI